MESKKEEEGRRDLSPILVFFDFSVRGIFGLANGNGRR
jgi:hypothetical protein